MNIADWSLRNQREQIQPALARIFFYLHTVDNLVVVFCAAADAYSRSVHAQDHPFAVKFRQNIGRNTAQEVPLLPAF